MVKSKASKKGERKYGDDVVHCNSCTTYNICRDFGQFPSCRKGNREPKAPKVYSDQWFKELQIAKQKPETAKIVWMGFDLALLFLDNMYASSHPHKYNIADCIKAKVNRLPKSKIRKNNNGKKV